MECNLAQLLIHFSRPASELPAEERQRLTEHLAGCPACRELAEREMAFDEAVGWVMNDVPAPGELRGQILARLGEKQGRPTRRKLYWYSGAAAALAASLLLALSFPLGLWQQPTVITASQLQQDEDSWFIAQYTVESSRKFFEDRGVRTVIPSDFDFQFLRHMEVVKLHGHDVARLDFANGQYRATVYVLPKKHFRFDSRNGDSDTGSHCSVEVVDISGEFLFVYFFFEGAERKHFIPRPVVG